MNARYWPCLGVKIGRESLAARFIVALVSGGPAMNIRYRVDLREAERAQLTAMLGGGKHAARKLKRAQILLAADAGVSDEMIAILRCRWRHSRGRRLPALPHSCPGNGPGRWSRKRYLQSRHPRQMATLSLNPCDMEYWLRHLPDTALRHAFRARS